MDRRHFLSTPLVAVAAFTCTTVEASSSKRLATTARRANAAVLSESRFRGLVGSRFQFAGEDWRGPLQLTDVVTRPADTRVEQFTTIFRTDQQLRPAPGVYTVKHPEMGEFTLRIDGRPESELRLATFALLRG